MADTIAAIATGLQKSALGIIRLSGDEAISIAEAAFRPAFGGGLRDRPPRKLLLGDILDGDGQVLDQVLLFCSPGPGSFTGEDTVELQGHGSPAALSAILRRLFDLGARQAGPGEFSRRAFLNGRLDLTQAEAIIDLIDSETPLAAKNAAAQLHGAVTRKTDAVYEALLAMEAQFQAAVDYPDEGVDPLENAQLARSLREAEATLSALLGSFRRSQVLKEGVPCALLGKPNAGKSSLLNALLGRERAIVTDQAGTTRDTLEEKLTMGGLLLRLTDTAGLRRTRDLAEAQGVERALEAGREATLVLAVFDGSEPLGNEDRQVLQAAGAARQAIALINKCDLPRQLERQQLDAQFSTVLEVSARTGQGLDRLEACVRQLLEGEAPLQAGEVITNARQYDAIRRAREALCRAAGALEGGLTPDAVLTDAEEALSALGELSGRTLREDLVDAIFTRFCVGK